MTVNKEITFQETAGASQDMKQECWARGQGEGQLVGAVGPGNVSQGKA